LTFRTIKQQITLYEDDYAEYPIPPQLDTGKAVSLNMFADRLLKIGRQCFERRPHLI
jgi:hypothetical protein